MPRQRLERTLGVESSRWSWRRVTGWWKLRGRALVNAILCDEWNPIGINAPPDAYSGYAGTVGRRLGEGRSETVIATFLTEAREHMGVDPDPVADRAVAVRLVSIYPSGGWNG